MGVSAFSGKGVGDSSALPGGGPAEIGVAAATVVGTFTEGVVAGVKDAFKESEPEAV